MRATAVALLVAVLAGGAVLLGLPSGSVTTGAAQHGTSAGWESFRPR